MSCYLWARGAGLDHVSFLVDEALHIGDEDEVVEGYPLHYAYNFTQKVHLAVLCNACTTNVLL
jgi:hypothetical protein